MFRWNVALQFLYLLPRGFSCVTIITVALLDNVYSAKWVPIDYYLRLVGSKFGRTVTTAMTSRDQHSGRH